MRYIGIPYKDRGRTEKGCDCWGIIKLWYKKELGVKLPDFDISAMDRDEVVLAMEESREGDNWCQVENPEVGDIVAMSTNAQYPGMVNHVGVFVGKDRFIHTTEKTGAMATKITDIMWRSRIVGYYRWVN